MSILKTKNRHMMVWPTGYGHLQRISEVGDKITQVGLFFFNIKLDGSIWSALDTDSNNLSGNYPNLDSTMDYARSLSEKWPHINMLITVKNDGFESILRSILTSAAATERFIDQINQWLDHYPWVEGVDLDLERLPNDLEQQIYQLYENIHRSLKNRSTSRHIHVDLPPMTGPGETVGPETWCDYGRMRPFADTFQIMTYGFAWAGSAPGPTSPVDWLKRVLEYAVSAFDRNTVFTGIPAYGHRWQIYDYPENLDDNYRGTAGAYDPFLQWMLGDLSHTDSYRTGTETQAYVPFASFIDEDLYHWLYLHVYDYPGAKDVNATELAVGTYGNKDFLTAYQKFQKTAFTGEIISLKGTDYSKKSGAIGENENTGVVYPRRPAPLENDSGETVGYEDEGELLWKFTIPESGVYTLAMEVNFTWWNSQKLSFLLDGQAYTVGNVEQWYPYYRLNHWYKLDTKSFTAGEHTLVLRGSDSEYNTQLYQIKIVKEFTEEFTCGDANFELKPRYFIDKDRNPAWPNQNKFKLTLETLRRDPENVTMWYDDFRDWSSSLPSTYYNDNGSWKIEKPNDTGTAREYTILKGSGHVEIDYASFQNVHVKSRIRLDQANNKAGVTFANLWCCLNNATQTIQLYEGSNLLREYTLNNPITAETFYTISLRVRDNIAAVFLNDFKLFEISLNSGVRNGHCGLKADRDVTSDLFVISDSYWYYPQEAFDVVIPNGETVRLGRILRENIEWADRWGYFKVVEGEEIDTRLAPEDGLSSSISMDWDYLHSKVFELAEPGDYPLLVKPLDIGVWLSIVFLGDADGYSIVCFPDADTLMNLGNIAAYEFAIHGTGMWNIGQEDDRFWNMLVSHV